jgi:succinate dehydrogenase/fumarate reductase flavoprotein subunit
MSKKQQDISTQAIPVADVSAWTHEADVVIAGYGGAGACAAIEAAEHKADVVILEAASGAGGSTALSSSEIYFGGDGGTPAQKKNGFKDTNKDMFNYLMMAGGANADEDRVRMYVENSIKHYEWLTSKVGMEFNTTFVPEKNIIHLTDDCLLYTGSEEAYPFNTAAKPCPRGHKPKVTGDVGGTYLVSKLEEQVKQRDNIKVLFDARATRLVQGTKGQILGIAYKMDGKVHYLRARQGVILCTGGFGMNREMVREHAPKLMRHRDVDAIGNPNDTGSGIRMGMGAGGAAINMGEAFVSIPFYPPSDFVKAIFVNSQGQRFINEDCYHGRVGYYCQQQRDDAIYLIVDAELFDKPSEYLQPDIAATGESIEELEKELGMPVGSLQGTMKVFNHYAALGEDPMWGKHSKFLKPLDKGPWAAFDCSIGKVYYPYFTLGGLSTLPTGEVLDHEHEPVPGLYAAGRNACGLPRTGAGYSSGMSVGDATFFGRMAGINAAKASATTE